jgi:hypothetical protein
MTTREMVMIAMWGRRRRRGNGEGRDQQELPARIRVHTQQKAFTTPLLLQLTIISNISIIIK